MGTGWPTMAMDGSTGGEVVAPNVGPISEATEYAAYPTDQGRAYHASQVTYSETRPAEAHYPPPPAYPPTVGVVPQRIDVEAPDDPEDSKVTQEVPLSGVLRSIAQHDRERAAAIRWNLGKIMGEDYSRYLELAAEERRLDASADRDEKLADFMDLMGPLEAVRARLRAGQS